MEVIIKSQFSELNKGLGEVSHSYGGLMLENSLKI
jgi:hypothetical protein